MTSLIHFNQSSIYIAETIPKNFQEVEQLFQPPAVPAFERIGRIYARAIQILQEGPLENQTPELWKLLKLLGVEETQKKVASWTLGLLRALPNLSSCSANKDSSGVYTLSNPLDLSERFGCKISEKRAALEILAAKHAHRMGLDEHVISGLYCTIQAPPPHKADDPLIVEQWNSLDKEFKETPKFGVGILEPWLTPTQSDDPHLSFAKMLLVALSIGLRDGKKDGVIKDTHTLFDVEDCFPKAIDPQFSDIKTLRSKGMTATDLPFLDDPLSLAPLSLNQIALLVIIVEGWDIIELSSQLKKEPILYADRLSEKQPLNQKGRDETGTLFIPRRGEPHGINHKHRVDIDRQRTILNEQQLIATTVRMSRLKQFILEKHEKQELFPPVDMVYAVDPYCELYIRTIKESGDSKFLRGGSPFKVIGRYTPGSLELSDELMAGLARFPSQSPGDDYKEYSSSEESEAEESTGDEEEGYFRSIDAEN